MKKKRLFWLLFCILTFITAAGGCGGSDSYVDTPSSQLTVDPAFLSDLEFAEEVLFDDESEDILVSVTIDPAEKANSVALYETNERGDALNLIAHLLDDGNGQTGDVLPRDGIFGFLISSTSRPNEIGSYYYRVFLDTGTTRGSSMVELEIVENIAAAAYEEAMLEAEGIIGNVIPGYDGEIDESAFQRYKNGILARLLESSNVLRAEFSKEKNAILATFVSGVELCVTYDKTRVDAPGIREVIARELPNWDLVARPLLAGGPPSAKTAAISIGAYSAYGLSPFYDQFSGWGGDDSDYAYRLLQNSTHPLFATGSPIRNEGVSTEHFKDIARYGVVILASHGTVVGEEPTIVLSKKHSAAEIDALRKDISSGALLLQSSGEIFIGPKFITRYNGGKGDGYINLGICQGIMREELADALLKSGFAGVTGFTDNVGNDYAYNCSGTMIEAMLTGESFKEAYATTVAKLGAQDPKGNARFVMRIRDGVDDFYIASGDVSGSRLTGIRNGDFSQSDSHWGYDGDGYVSILPTLSGLSPVSGKLMALIATGFGGGTGTTASLEQTFAVPQRAATLSFHFDFVSEHPHSSTTPQSSLDEFRAYLIDSDGNETLLIREIADTLHWSPISSDIFGNGAEQAYHTGWRRIECDIPDEFQGRQATLVFRVTGEAGCGFDSAILLDDIMLNAK